MISLWPRDRGISPVVGVALLVAIVVALSALAGGVFLGLAEEREPTPDVAMSLEASGEVPGEYRLVHDHGDTLDGENVRLRGVASVDGLGDEELAAAESHRVFPTGETVEVVWLGDDETSYVLQEFSVDPDTTVPAPDEGCDWVDSETNSGTEDAKVDGLVVACDVETDKVVELQNGGAVVGDVESHNSILDADDGRIYGDATVEDTINLQETTATGSLTARTGDAKVDDSTVGGSVEAERVVEVGNGAAVDGDVESRTKDAKVLGGSTVGGSVAADGQVKLDDATVEGDVYVDGADFDCTDSTVRGRDCGSYSPKDPDDA